MTRLSRHDAFDFSLAGVLLVANLLDVATGALGGTYPGSVWAHLLFALATSVPVAFRRRQPLGALIAVAVPQTVWIYLLFPIDQQPPVIPFLQLLVVVYSAAAYSDGRAARAAMAVVVIGILSDLPTLFAGKPVGQLTAPDVTLIIAFGIGMVFARARREIAAKAFALARAEVEQRDLAERAAATERARIAQELHDVISHNVSMMVLQASVERRVRASEEETDRVLETIEVTGREALQELRQMLGVLHHGSHADPLRPQPGLTGLPELIDQSRASGLRARLVLEGEETAVPPGLGIAAYRIVQESLTNAAKYASGAEVTATVRVSPHALEVEVVDDGPGGVPATLPAGGGHGLVGMRERVAVFGGTLDTGRRPNGGFRVRALLPLPS